MSSSSPKSWAVGRTKALLSCVTVHLIHRRATAAICCAASLALLILSGCEKAESANWVLNGFLDPTQVGQFREQRRNEIRGALSILEEPIGIQNTEEPAPADLQPDYSDQKIAAGDTLNISILELINPGEPYVQQLRVSPSGFETIPVIGRVRVGGLTLRELELEIKELLRTAQVLQDAEVQVTLLDTRQTQYSVIGSISRPGTYPVPTPEYRLLNALAEAGGVSPQIDRIYVFRRGAAKPGEEPAPQETSQSQIPFAFMMSDVSTSSASAPSSAATSSKAPETSRPAASTAVDELKILEGTPAEAAGVPRWDAEKGDWIIDPPASKPNSPTAPARPTGTLARLAKTTSKAASDEKIDRPSPEDMAAAQRIIEIPTKELLDGDPRYNILVRPFDLINVPSGNVGEYFLMGNVARAGAYDLTGRRITVKEAIASGGGFGPLAWPSRADLVRRVGKDEEQMIQLDLDAIFAGNAPDFYLKPNDIVNVGTNPAATFLAVLRNAFRLSYGFGFVYDRNFADGDGFQAHEQLKQRRLQEKTLQGLPHL